MTPGPVTLSPAVRAAMNRPTALHYGPEWVEEYDATERACRRLFGTANELLLMFGPGSAGLEAALGSVLSRGDSVVIPTNGPFGDRLVEIAKALRLKVHRVDASWFEPLPVDRVSDALSGTDARAIAFVHHETMLGVVNPIDDIASLGVEHEMLVIADAVSSLGGIPVEFDRYQLDVCVGVSNKCIGGPVGVAPIAVSDRAWWTASQLSEQAAGWYLNLLTWRRYKNEWGDWHPQPTTMPQSAVRGLQVALGEIHAVGFESHVRMMQSTAATVRRGVESAGFDCVIPAAWASPVLTAARAPSEFDVHDYLDFMKDTAQITLTAARREDIRDVIRIAHIGQAAVPESVDRFLDATRQYVMRRRRDRPRG